MYARFSTFKAGLERLDEGVELFREAVRDDESRPGFAGALLLVDREAELAHAVTLWESEAAMAATDERSRRLAEAGAKELGLRVSIRYFEAPFSTFPALVR